MVEQPLRHRERREGKVEHQLAILAQARVIVARTGRNQPRAVPVETLADAVHRHHHRTVDAEHDLVKVVHIRRFERVVALQGDGGGRKVRHGAARQPAARVPRQTSSSSTSNTSVAFGGITPPAPRGP